jgi:hypothetical protein
MYIVPERDFSGLKVTVFSNGKKAAKHDLRHEAQFLS